MLLAQSVFTFTYHLPDTHCGRNVMLNMMRKFSALKFRTQFELYQSIDRFRLENYLPVLSFVPKLLRDDRKGRESVRVK